MKKINKNNLTRSQISSQVIIMQGKSTFTLIFQHGIRAKVDRRGLEDHKIVGINEDISTKF